MKKVMRIRVATQIQLMKKYGPEAQRAASSRPVVFRDRSKYTRKAKYRKGEWD